MVNSLPEERVVVQDCAFYIVATPIGHLDDLSERAKQVLRNVTWVACEDTRTSRPLLTALASKAKTMALHQHNEQQAAQTIVQRLQAGESVALISDAGTPAISDPGAIAVAAVHAAGLRVVPIPGASALTALLSACGLFTDEGILFAGFLPQTAPKRRAKLSALLKHPGIVVWYEAPHRIVECLADLQAVGGLEGQSSEESRKLVIGRELTKQFEQIVCTTLADAPAWLASNPNHQRGEFVLAVGPTKANEALPSSGIDLDDFLRVTLAELPASTCAKLAHKLLGVPRDQAYSRANAIQKIR